MCDTVWRIRVHYILNFPQRLNALASRARSGSLADPNPDRVTQHARRKRAAVLPCCRAEVLQRCQWLKGFAPLKRGGPLPDSAMIHQAEGCVGPPVEEALRGLVEDVARNTPPRAPAAAWREARVQDAGPHLPRRGQIRHVPWQMWLYRGGRAVSLTGAVVNGSLS